MNFNIFNTIILMGVLQGFIFAIVVLSNKKYRAAANFFLVAWIITYSLSNLQYYLYDTGIVTRYEFYLYVFIQWGLLMPTLVILYGHRLINPGRKISLGEKLLFLPFILGLISTTAYKVTRLSGSENESLYQFFDQLTPISEFLAVIYSLVAIIYILLRVRKHENSISFSTHKVEMQLSWFKKTLVLLFLATILWGVTEYLYGEEADIYYFYPLWIIVAFLIYWLGHLGIYKYGVNEERKQMRKAIEERYSVSVVEPRQNEHLMAMERFLKEERNFLNPNMSLDMIAGELDLSTGHLSKMINTEMGMSFKNYLNALRVEEAKRYLIDPEFGNYTLAAIGLEAGFNSKSAFNASFKKITGVTPSQFKEQAR